MELMMLKPKVDRQTDRRVQVSDYGKRKLLTYADSFRELAKSLEGNGCLAAEDREKALEAQRLWENRQVLCRNLNEVAQIMDSVASEVFRYRPLEEKKGRLITHALRAEGIVVSDLFYIEQPGERTRIGLTMYTEKSGGYTAEEAADMLSVLLNRRLTASVTSPYFLDQTLRSYVFVEEARYMVLTGFARAVKENEAVSGDNHSIIESETGKMTVLVSDGMGSGEKACADSEKVLDLMEKLLEAGYSLDAGLSLVNSALIACGEEQNMSTLDICDLDLYEGSCEFRKVGAAASFLKRENAVEQISTHSLPLGIFQSVEPEIIRRELMDGDYAIMVTDGVLDALRQNGYEEALLHVLRDMAEQNPKEIADRLLQFVLRCSGGRVQDDMTIIVIGMWENS